FSDGQAMLTDTLVLPRRVLVVLAVFIFVVPFVLFVDFSVVSLVKVSDVAPNIVISRIFSAYFLRFPLISAANAEEESAFFGASFGQNRRFPAARRELCRII